MSTRRLARIPNWKQALAIACILYAALAWVLPVFMLPFVNILPFVHERSVLERLPFSVAGSVLMTLTLIGLNGGRVPPGTLVRGGKRERLTHWLGVSAGLAMFTYFGAALSANVLGIAAKVLPHQDYRAEVMIEAADYYGSRYKSVVLEYKEPKTSEARYLTISKRLFSYPVLKPGDVVELRGGKSIVGVYVDEFSVLDARLTGQSSGLPTAALHFRR